MLEHGGTLNQRKSHVKHYLFDNPEPPVYSRPMIDIMKTVISHIPAIALAEILGRTRQVLYLWDRVPAEHVLKIEAATGGKVDRHALRPDLYPEEAAEGGR